MHLEEKAGLMFINGSKVAPDGSLDEHPDAPGFGGNAKQMLLEHRMHFYNLWDIPDAAATAKWHNNLQKLAEESRLGIPVAIASDPRNHFSQNIFSMSATDFSQWCETLGFGALDDPALVQQFADIARQEYLAIGIRISLHPQIDLATEPRWPRISGSFSEDAYLTARLVKAYIAGFQGEKLGPHSVACMTKHFPGGGPQNEGLDPHFEFQKGQIYPGGNFEYHLIPFEAAFEAQTAAIMPYYGIPVDQTDENVAMAFNKVIITDLLREKYGFDGVICSDWGVLTDLQMPGFFWPARAWGVEHLSEAERVLKAVDAGVDQFGGENCPHHIVDLVKSGQLSEERIDQSVRRLLGLQFELGLFDNPFVDEDALPQIFGNPESTELGLRSQQQAMTLLKNEDDLLPLSGRLKLYVKEIDKDVAGQYGDVVDSLGEADLAIIRLQTPWVPFDTPNLFAQGFHHGDLDFKGEALAEILAILEAVPTIVVLYLDRPAVIPKIAAGAKALLADYGASDTAVLEVIFGAAQPKGNLPFELPSSMEAVHNQKPDLPYDSDDPLFEFGFGLRYADRIDL